MNRTLEMLAGQREQVAEHLRPDVDRLLGQRDRLVHRLERGLPGQINAQKTRFHGDYHLGQVLVVGNDVQIIDFEGEQPRPGQPRMLKHSPLRDVAGMLRSFDYAAHAAVFGVGVGRPDDREVVEPVARLWYDEATEAFLGGYLEAIEGALSYPKDPDVANRLIELFVLEKALYEVNYELNHRPDWLAIPLKGILSLLEGDPERSA
jgi:maltose alpha-D-glucosyltransferase/alpha-amylase